MRKPFLCPRAVLFFVLIILLICVSWGSASSAAGLKKTARLFAYVANQGSNNISAFKIDPDTGSLKEIYGSPFYTGSFPAEIALDPCGNRLYVQAGAPRRASVCQRRRMYPNSSRIAT